MRSLVRRLDYRLGFGSILCVLLMGNFCGEPGTMPLDPDPDVNQPPEPVVLPPDLTEVSVGLPVRADATGSTDPEGDALSYEWSLTPPTGSVATLDNQFSATPMFTPDIPGDYDLALELDDGVVRSGTNKPFASVTITAVDRSSATTVDDTGGEVVSSDGRLRIVVPAGALATPTEIVITVAAPSQFPGAFAALDLPGMEGFDLQPAGLTFTVPATASISMEGAYSVAGGQYEAFAGAMIRPIGEDVDVLANMDLRPDVTEPTTAILSAEIDQIGPVGVIGGLEAEDRFLSVRADPPSQVPAGDAFDIEVTALPKVYSEFGPSTLASGVARDGSLYPVTPDPAEATDLDVNLVKQSDGRLTAILDYLCDSPGQGEWISSITVEGEWIMGPMSLNVVLRWPIECIAPDVTPPTVVITVPTSADTYATINPTVILGGTASDDTGVTGITWVNDQGGSGTPTGLEDWTASIPLSVGANELTVTAEDAAGNYSSDVLTVTYTPPTASERLVSRATWISPGAGGTEILIGGTGPERFDVLGGTVTPLGDGSTFGAGAAHHVYPVGGGLYANDVIGHSWHWDNPTDGWQLIYELYGDHAQQFSLGTDGILYGAAGLAHPRTVGTDFSLDYYPAFEHIQAYWSDGTTDVLIQTGGDGNAAFNDSYPVVGDVGGGGPLVALSGNPFSEVLDEYQRLDRSLACISPPADATMLVCLFAGGQTSPGSLVDGQSFVDGTYAIFEVDPSAKSGTNLEGSRTSGVGASAFSYMGRSGLAWADQEANSIEIREVGTTGITWSRSIPLGSTCTKIFDFTVTPNGEYGVASCWGDDGSGGADDKYVWAALLLGTGS